jgi:predicted metalloprotease
MAFWDKLSSRGRVEDRRALTPVVGSVGIGGLALYFLASMLLGEPIDMGQVIGQLEQTALIQQQPINPQDFEGEDSYEVFASTVLGSNNDMWQSIFERNNRQYTEPKLVLFRTATQSACGTATSQVGPHYCPLDNTIYLDETFFEELQNRLGAQGGDVAEAYVIAHEVGHHIQNQLGILDTVHSQTAANTAERNELSVQVELQADCFAGLWAHSIRDAEIFLPGEINEAMDAAAAVGDDRIQEKVTGSIQPETWTHGSAEQRVNAFTRGFETGELSVCNSF